MLYNAANTVFLSRLSSVVSPSSYLNIEGIYNNKGQEAALRAALLRFNIYSRKVTKHFLLTGESPKTESTLTNTLLHAMVPGAHPSLQDFAPEQVEAMQSLHRYGYHFGDYGKNYVNFVGFKVEGEHFVNSRTFQLVFVPVRDGEPCRKFALHDLSNPNAVTGPFERIEDVLRENDIAPEGEFLTRRLIG